MCIEDAELEAGNILPASANAQSIMLAPVYHAKYSNQRFLPSSLLT